MSEKRTLRDIKTYATGYGFHPLGEDAMDEISTDIMACVPEDVGKYHNCGKKTSGECSECLHCVRNIARDAILEEVRRNLKEYLGVK